MDDETPALIYAVCALAQIDKSYLHYIAAYLNSDWLDADHEVDYPYLLVDDIYTKYGHCHEILPIIASRLTKSRGQHGDEQIQALYKKGLRDYLEQPEIKPLFEKELADQSGNPNNSINLG